MANATIVKTGNGIRVTLNDEATKFGYATDLLSAAHIDRAHPHGEEVELYLTDNERIDWTHDASYSGEKALIITSIDAGDGGGIVTTDTQAKLINQIDVMMQ